MLLSFCVNATLEVQSGSVRCLENYEMKLNSIIPSDGIVNPFRYGSSMLGLKQLCRQLPTAIIMELLPRNYLQESWLLDCPS